MAKNLAVILKYTLLLGIAALIGAGSYYFINQPTAGDSIFKTEIGGEKGIKGKIKNIRLMEKMGEGEVWELTATAVSLNDDVTEMRDIDMIYHSAQRGPITLLSDTGTLETGSQNAVFNGNVRVRSPKPLFLTTEQLHWDTKTRLMTTDKKVRIVTGGAIIHGEGLIINADSQKVTVKHSVKATFN